MPRVYVAVKWPCPLPSSDPAPPACSCVLDSDGTPVLLYTGVRLRSNESAGELPPPEQDLGMVWIETQLAAVPEDPGKAARRQRWCLGQRC